MDGRTMSGKITQTPGGVGRNIADALSKLHMSPPLLLSAVGPDLYGQFLLTDLKHLNCSGVEIKEGFRTACYTTLIDRDGETRFGVGDMDIHSTINKEQVLKHRKDIMNSSILVLDGNIPEETIKFALEIAKTSNLSVWFEPTDLSKAHKPFKTELWQYLAFITPNLAELKEMARNIGKELHDEFSFDNREKLINQIIYLVNPLAEKIPIVMVTMGRHGILMHPAIATMLPGPSQALSSLLSSYPGYEVFMASQIRENEPVLDGFSQRNKKIYFRYYQPLEITKVQNTSGAGDCTASGFISAALTGYTEPECVELGLKAGLNSLQSTKPVPDRFIVHTQQDPNISSFTEHFFQTKKND